MYFNRLNFGIRIQELRMAQGKTQEELAEKLNISRETLSRMERGSQSCSIDRLIELSVTFHVSTDYLLTGKSSDKSHDRNQLLEIIGQLSEIARNM